MKSGSVYKNFQTSEQVPCISMVKKSSRNKYSFCREHYCYQTIHLLKWLLEQIIT